MLEAKKLQRSFLVKFQSQQTKGKEKIQTEKAAIPRD
jgi:hypothetical protein